MANHPLSDKVALITGAARRIGAEIARTLHASGMRIVLHYHASHEEALALSHELNEKKPDSATILRADLSDTSSLQGLINNAVSVWGRLDVLVNNASRFYRTAVGQVSDFAWADLIDSNIKAPFFLSQAAAPHLAKSKGTIVNITDIHGERPISDYSVYCISKSGLLMMTKVLAKELAPHIRVNAVSPGAILWPEGENELSEQDKEKIIKRTMLHRAGGAADIAKAVLYFVRDADYVTGQVLSVDGGRLLSG